MDLTLLLSAVSEASPCGEDLEYDADFLQLEREAKGQPERAMGDSVLPAEPPKWRDIQQLSLQLLGRSRDLRITHFLTHSQLALEGFAGLADALMLVRELLDRYWEPLYPQLDADDHNDPTLRLNALMGLCGDTTLQLLRDTPLLRSRAFGPVTLRAAANAAGLQHWQSETLTAEQFGGALIDADADALQATVAALNNALEALDAIERMVGEHLGASQGIDLAPLRQPLRLARQLLSDAVPASTEAEPQAGDAPAHDSPQHAVQRPAGAVGSRDDVQRTLDRLLEYYQRHEPSSPVPVLLSRARQLVHADFAAIVRNLLPDGMSQFETLRGPDPE
ncbi:type VI secretion system protein TssA [Pseudomonas sp. KNUC1026]|uniref:type VI secretion system protein TssA n=1 Tax=Pseudomonas sp. KNUC1026 TaxID=2893890 RepID=UPI001F39CC04|nr:type VI secretion system protein TssA [Pseudomonas sp. KNUC1026]UFH51763.1 type VI secretion system protein TssA [Pseudomonas sp. KNUC1026]